MSRSKFETINLAPAFRRGLVDRVEVQQRIAREIHLGDQAGDEAGAEQREMDMVRPPAIGMVAPRVRARLDGIELVAPLRIGNAAPAAPEVRVQRRVVLVVLVDIASGGVGLPDLDQRVGQRATIFVQHPAGDDDALAQRLAIDPRILRHVVIQRANALMAVDRSGQFRQRLFQRDQRLGRPAQHRRFVVRINIGRLADPVARAEGSVGGHGLPPSASSISW